MKTYAFAGASGRGLFMYGIPMHNDYRDHARIVGVYDINIGRSQYFSAQTGGTPVFDDFDRMLSEANPDVVIITTVDAFHSEYAVRALRAGCNVITEKPMATDAEKCCAILNAERQYGGKVIVTFNYRYAPYATKIKELIRAGAIGMPYSVHFEWLLDRVMAYNAHGASYFRRWNSRMPKSGGLLVHKATHHFDLINWFLDVEPERVAAFGKLNLYGINGRFRSPRCLGCVHKTQCGFYHELPSWEVAFYRDNEQYDGYMKDGCVFAEDIDIFDTMSATVQYRSGVMMTYSLNATTAYEGYRLAINGSAGRLEAFMPETGPLSHRDSDAVTIFGLDGSVTEHVIPRDTGGHGGGDVRLRDALFAEQDVPDPLGYQAGTKAGIDSVLIGAAANISIREKRFVTIDELLNC